VTLLHKVAYMLAPVCPGVTKHRPALLTRVSVPMIILAAFWLAAESHSGPAAALVTAILKPGTGIQLRRTAGQLEPREEQCLPLLAALRDPGVILRITEPGHLSSRF